MKKLAFTCLPLLPLLLTACETTIEVPEPEHTPRVALVLTLDNLRADDSVRRREFPERQTFVSVSQRLYNLNRPEGRTDANIEVKDAAGTVVQRYRHTPFYSQNGMYRPTLNYRFQSGQDYSVRVTVPGVEPAESRLTLPTTVPVEASMTRLNSQYPGQERVRLTVSFDDPANSTDYYMASGRLLDASGNMLMPLYVDDEGDGTVNVSRYRLSNPGSMWDLYPFTDTNANGQRISFSNVVTYYTGMGGPTGGQPTFVEVTLTHLTRDLYLFMNSQRQYNDNNGNPFAEPTPLYSNVKPGFGIFGGAADATYRIRL